MGSGWSKSGIALAIPGCTLDNSQGKNPVMYEESHEGLHDERTSVMSDNTGVMRPSQRLIRMGDTIHVELNDDLAVRLEDDGGRRIPRVSLEDMLSETMAHTEYGERLWRELNEHGTAILDTHRPTGSSAILTEFQVANKREAQLLQQLIDLANNRTFAIVNLWVALATKDDQQHTTSRDNHQDADDDGDVIDVSVEDDMSPLAGDASDDDEPHAGSSSDEKKRLDPADLASLDVNGRCRVLLAMIDERDRHITTLEQALDDMSDQWMGDRTAIITRLNELTQYLQAMQHRWEESQVAPASQPSAVTEDTHPTEDDDEDEDERPAAKATAPHHQTTPAPTTHSVTDQNPLLPPDGQLADWTPPTQRPSADDKLIQLVAGPFSQAAIDTLLNDTDTLKEAIA